MVTAPEALLTHLVEVGVSLVVEGDRLRAQAPKGVLTPALRNAIARYKPDLVALVSAGATLPDAAWWAKMRRAVAPRVYDAPPGCSVWLACSRLGPCERHAARRPCLVPIAVPTGESSA